MRDGVFGFRDRRVSSDGTRVEVGFTDARSDLRGTGDGFAAQWTALEAACGVPVVRSNQVHGDEVREVTSDDLAPPGSPTLTADGLATREPGLGLVTRAADCVPLVLADPDAGVIAAIHSGRPGTALGIASRAVERMHELGARRLTGWIGPHVCGRCYEVPEAMREEVAAAVPAMWAETRQGTPALDVGGGVRAQLVQADVEVVEAGTCTMEDPGLHSYRRDGQRSGRMAGVVWMMAP